MSRSSLRSLFASTLILGSCGLVSACSEPDTDRSEDTAARQEFPEGAASVLSIGGRVASEGDDEFDIAVNCAAALRITAETIGNMTSTSDSPEIRTIKRAADSFEQQADSLGEPDAAARAIESRISEKSESSGEQAQLAIACARKLDAGE